jgi:hypothetical protein
LKTVRDVIEGGKWNQALFTTFALSLSFFESILLRSLRQVGCQEVWVVSDLQGYRASLMERRSNAVGQDYRLIPMRLGNGVFHPKCIYLSGPDEDALIVGSGNLTFGGFGRNLEVLEAFSSKQTPWLFSDFADFLALTKARTDLQCPDLSWCSKFETRARSVGTSSTEPQQISLLHSAKVPVIDQLVQTLIAEDEMTVMSPFYDVDGFSIREVAKRLGCKTINVAVPPKTGAFNFPFDAAKAWKQQIDPVWVEEHDSARPVHAKWFEFKDSTRSSVMSGSVNATRQVCAPE